MSGTGTLKVKLSSADPYVRQPVNVIDAKTLQLVASPACDEEIQLPEGTYLVSAVQPSGQRSVGAIEVASEPPSRCPCRSHRRRPRHRPARRHPPRASSRGSARRRERTPPR